MSSKKPRSAIDGISNNPKHATTAVTKYIDWEQLKREFMLAEGYPMVATWLQEVKGWSVKQIKAGNTTRNCGGWGKEKAKFEQEKTEAKIKAALELERRNVPTLRRAKAKLIANIVKDVGRWDRLNMMDKKLCYEILKVELREPTNVKDLQPDAGRDPVEALLEEYGLIKDGEVIIDDEPESDPQLVSGADSQKAATADSKASAEVSQD
jgi:hypothetical protein